MAERLERILALDIDAAMVRGIVLAHGPQAVAGGYAQLGYDTSQAASAVAARIAAALDVKATLPVVVTCTDSFDEAAVAEIANAVAGGGFSDITVVPRDEAIQRSNPGGGQPDKLVDADIAAGLLTSHAGLTLSDLAPVVGAGLGALGMGAPLATEVQDDPVEVWHPEAPPATSDDSDPFTAGTAAAAAAGAVAGMAAASAFDDDPTQTRDDVASEIVVDQLSDGDDTVAPVADDDITDALEEPTTTKAGDGELPHDAQVASAAAVSAEQATPETDVDGDAPGPSFVAAPAAAASAGVGAAAVAATAPSSTQRRSRGPLVALVLGLLAALALGAFVFLSGGDDDVATETEPEAVAETEVLQATVEPEPTTPPTTEPTTAPAPTAEPAVEPEPTAEPTADPLEGLPPLSDLPARGAIFRPPTLFLEGPVQTQEQADELYERAVAVVGPDNVVNNYVVRPDAPAASDGNVRVEQAVLFGSGSATISEEFIPTLELGVAVMALNPQVQMVVEGHTDSIGDETLNRRLSERRAQAVVEYLVSRGVDRGRLEAVGFGEANPVATNETEQGRQVNRRIEVNLLDLLAGE